MPLHFQFSVPSPTLRLCSAPNPQPLTPGKWLWWKATQKPGSIYTLCFLTEHSQTVTCRIETTTGIFFPLFFPYLIGSSLCCLKENDPEIVLLLPGLCSCVQKYIGDFRSDNCFLTVILQVSLSPQRCPVSRVSFLSGCHYLQSVFQTFYCTLLLTCKPLCNADPG